MKKEEIKPIELRLEEQFGAEKVAAWKKQYAPRKLNVIDVETLVAVLRPIGATEVANYSMMVANPEMGLEKATRYLMEELWIDGDRRLLDDEEFFISSMLQVQNVIELKKSSFYRL